MTSTTDPMSASPISVHVKTCTKCGEQKPLEEYSRQRLGKLGRRANCKTCAKAYRAANLDRHRARDHEYAAANRQKILARQAEWRVGNRSRLRKQQAEYAAVNRDRILKQWADNPHFGWEANSRQRMRRAGFEPIIEHFTRDDLIARYGDACAHCGGPFEQLDHYPVPISRGGAHTLDNCRPSCADCNQESWREEVAP